MRSLEECKREIIKKSREQIKRRKKIRISVICIALCVISVPLIIRALPEKNLSENAEEKLPDVNITAEETLIYEALPGNEAQAEINIKEAENKKAYDTLYGEIINIFKAENKNSSSGNDGRNIKISLENTSGLKHIYIISKGRITDINTGTEVYISPYEINKIIKITEEN